MSIWELIQLLFKKMGDKEVILKQLQTIWHIPNLLKVVLITSLIIGSIYFGYSKIYTYELESIKTEINNINTKLIDNLYNTEYQDDMFYMYESLISIEQLIQYLYAEEQLHLKLLQHEFEVNHPNADIIDDIQSVMRRNDNNYKYYMNEFHRALKKLNPEIYKQFNDSLQLMNKQQF